jgi:hypothetical protein
MHTSGRMHSRRRTLAALLAAGAVAGTVLRVAFIGLVEHGPEPQCGTGMEALGCGLAALAGMALLSLLLAGVANYLLLRWRGVHQAAPVSTLVVVAFVAWSWSLDELTDGTGFGSVTLPLLVAALNVLLYAAVRWLGAKGWPVPVAAIGIVMATWPLAELSSRVERNRYAADRARQIETADFEVYEPLALDGYSTEELIFNDRAGAFPPWAEWSARETEYFGRSPERYTVRSFRVPDGFDPPIDCGPDRPFPSSGPTSCTEVARTSRDEPVYVDGGALFSNVQSFYVRRGDTLIVIGTGVGDDGLTALQVADLVNRLTPTD